MSERRSMRTACAVVVVVVSTTVLAVTAEAALTCFGKQVTIKGTSGKDRLRGTPRADVIAGLGGSDRILGRGGNDLICGGRGDDALFGGGGHDALFGGGGHDRINGQAGGDELTGGRGDDLLLAGRGFFHLFNPGGGDDRLTGTDGFDFVGYFSAPSGVTVDLAAGVATGRGTDTLTKFDGVEGSAFDDVLTGTDGSNFIEGGMGNDQISSGGNDASLDSPETSENVDFIAPDFFAPLDPEAPRGDDTVTGGSGVTVLLYDGAATGLDVNLASGNATGEGNDTLTNVQGVIGSWYDDTLMGDNQDNGFAALSGDNTINGAAGQDVLVYFDAISGVTANLATGTASGVFHVHNAQGEESSSPGTDSFSGMENIWGSKFADVLTGDAVANELYGGGGKDQVSGSGGNDLLDGGNGTDTIDGGDGTDQCPNGETKVNCESTAAEHRPGFAGRTPWAGSLTTFFLRPEHRIAGISFKRSMHVLGDG
ncbi:MAG: hypothetical protein H0U16_09500 [Actinobacteria bacterium]|nr:hypothetical protein [Actinomycetota bacterium]